MKQYKVYRNITKNCFSVLKYYKNVKGYRLLTHVTEAILTNVEARVSEAARQRVLNEKQKNVHAFLLCDAITELVEPTEDINNGTEIYYNPYRQDCFTVNGEPFKQGEMVVLTTRPSAKAYQINL
jgi:hypothetical protein